jgi:hypothetical protein
MFLIGGLKEIVVVKNIKNSFDLTLLLVIIRVL